jgi:hypothetical protein
MKRSTIVPKRCEALTTRKVRCRNQAILGDVHCRVHSKPQPNEDPSRPTRFGKSALKGAGEAVVKLATRTLIEVLVEMWQSGQLNLKPPFLSKQPSEVSPSEIERWYGTLDTQTRTALDTFVDQRTRRVRNRHDRTGAAGAGPA